MSWVVASIAAELWGVSLDHVMSQVRAGTVTSREEFGFLWVEVTAASQLARPPRARQLRSRRSRPKTFTRRPTGPSAPSPLTADELQILNAATVELARQDTPAIPQWTASSEPSEEAPIESIASTTPPPQPQISEGTSDENPEPDECDSPEEPDDGVEMNWRESRAKTSSSRRRPPG